METTRCDEWWTAVERERHGSLAEQPRVDAAFVNLVVHAPMPPRLRNELINRGYARMADRLNELLYAADERDGASPNFFCFAHWASSYVGGRMDSWRGRPVRSHLEDGNAAVFHSMARAFLSFELEVLEGAPRWAARRRIDREIPMGPRVNARVDPLVDPAGRTQLTSLTDPSAGLPAALVDEIDPRRELNPAGLLQAIRGRGFDEYLTAIATTGTDRETAILRGNAWLVISEQAMVGPALSQALRSLVRTATSPVQSLLRSRRVRHGRHVGPVRASLEDAWVVLISKTLEWSCPAGALPAAEPLRFRPNGPASIHRFLKDLDTEAIRSDEPFCYFSLPEVEREPLFWTALAHRLPVIFAVLVASQNNHWFSEGRLIQHEPWSGVGAALDAYAYRLTTSGAAMEGTQIRLPDEQRRMDWATAHRLFGRDRELIFAALFAHSLPATYTSPAGAAVLDLAAHNIGGTRGSGDRSLAGDSLPRLRTSQRFVDAMFDNPHPPGSPFDGPSPGRRTKIDWLDQIKDIHVHVREMIGAAVENAEGQVPDAGLFDDPLGYEQCIGAGVSFVVPVVRTLEDQFQISWTAEERDSWSRVWVEITFHQGLDAVFRSGDCDDYLEWGADHRPLPTDFSFGDLLHAESEIRRRHRSRSLSGVRLADKLRRDLEDAVPFMLRPLIGLGFNVFGDPTVNQMLLIPNCRAEGAAQHVLRRLPRQTQWLSRRFITMVLAQVDKAEEMQSWDSVYPSSPDQRRLGLAVESGFSEPPLELAAAA